MRFIWSGVVDSGTYLVDHFCYICLVFFLRLFIATLWSPAGKKLTSWRWFVMSNCELVTFPCGILGQVWYLIPDLCHLYYFVFLSCYVHISGFMYPILTLLGLENSVSVVI